MIKDLLRIFKMHKNITNDSIYPSSTIPINNMGLQFLRLEEVNSATQGIPRAVYDFRIYVDRDHPHFTFIDKPIITDNELKTIIDENSFSDFHYNRYRCFSPYSKCVEKSSIIEITPINRLIHDTHLQKHFIFFYVSILECDNCNWEHGVEYSLARHTNLFLSQLVKKGIFR